MRNYPDLEFFLVYNMYNLSYYIYDIIESFLPNITCLFLFSSSFLRKEGMNGYFSRSSGSLLCLFALLYKHTGHITVFFFRQNHLNVRKLCIMLLDKTACPFYQNLASLQNNRLNLARPWPKKG